MSHTSMIVAAAVIASGVALGAQAPTTTQPANTMSRQDPLERNGRQAFVKEAALGGMAEVDLGQLASTKATDEKVKAFAQKMVADHGKANDELKALASSKQMMVPTALDAKHKATCRPALKSLIELEATGDCIQIVERCTEIVEYGRGLGG